MALKTEYHSDVQRLFLYIAVPRTSITVEGQVSDGFLESNVTFQTSTDSELNASFTISDVINQTENPLKYPVAEEGFVSKLTYERFKNVVWFGLVPTFTFLGLAGNFFGLWFLLDRKLQQPFYTFLFGLMVIDLLYMTIVLIVDVITIIEQYDKALGDYISCYAYRNLNLIQSLTYSTCAHLIMVMSFERLMSIIFPLKLKYFGHRKYTILLVIFTFVLNAGLLMPAFFLVTPKETTNPTTGEKACISIPTQWAKEHVSFNQVYATCMLTVARLVPGTTTLVANVLIATFMGRRRFQRASLFAIQTTTKNDVYDQFKITFTLMILSVFLLSSLIPSALAQIWRKYYPNDCTEGGRYFYTYSFMVEFSYLLRVISAASDFFIYIFTSNASKTNCMEMLKAKFCCCLEQNKTAKANFRSTGSSDAIEAIDRFTG